MSLATTREILAHAVSRGSAVLAFNVITLEHAEAIAAGAQQSGSPVLLQVSENAVKFHGGRFAPILSACAHIAADSSVPIGIHLDHFTDATLSNLVFEQVASLGVSSVMVDAAHLEYEQNLSRTRDWTRLAHDNGLWGEAELGAIGGKEGAHAPGVRTDPADAVDFVSQTGVDGLAVAVGSAHAMTARDAELDIVLIAELARRVPVPLVLHGSSGVADEILSAAISAGIRKVNVGTALNIAFTQRVRDVLSADPQLVDPRRYLAEGREVITETVARLCSVVAAATDVRNAGAIGMAQPSDREQGAQ